MLGESRELRLLLRRSPGQKKQITPHDRKYPVHVQDAITLSSLSVLSSRSPRQNSTFNENWMSRGERADTTRPKVASPI